MMGAQMCWEVRQDWNVEAVLCVQKFIAASPAEQAAH